MKFSFSIEGVDETVVANILRQIADSLSGQQATLPSTSASSLISPSLQVVDAPIECSPKVVSAQDAPAKHPWDNWERIDEKPDWDAEMFYLALISECLIRPLVPPNLEGIFHADGVLIILNKDLRSIFQRLKVLDVGMTLDRDNETKRVETTEWTAINTKVSGFGLYPVETVAADANVLIKDLGLTRSALNDRYSKYRWGVVKLHSYKKAREAISRIAQGVADGTRNRGQD